MGGIRRFTAGMVKAKIYGEEEESLKSATTELQTEKKKVP